MNSVESMDIIRALWGGGGQKGKKRMKMINSSAM